MKKICFILLCVFAGIISIAIFVNILGVTMPEFDKKTQKYGFNTEEEQNFLCLSQGVMNSNLEVRMTASLSAVAYSRYLQQSNSGYDSGKISPEHNKLMEKALRSWKQMDSDDIRYISKECTRRTQDLLPKISDQLYKTFQDAGF